MKKILFLILLFLLACGFFYFKKNSKTITKKQKSTVCFDYLNNRSKDKNEVRKSIFIPYWTNWEDLINQDYQKLIYFGITVDKDGVDKNEVGYKKLEEFVSVFPQGKESWLTIRMTNTETNFSILDDPSSWQKIISQIIDTAKNYNFSGLVLDLEITGLPLDKLIKQINKFVKYFYTQTKDKNLKLAQAVYGDVFFRQRPFDVKFISQNSDEIMVMAYDFHKAMGTPGPNFPLNGREKYGCDLVKAADQFLSTVPAEKLTFVFGLYGYDWTIDEKERPIKQAKALTLKQIKTKFGEKSENIKRDLLSAESFIKYTDENNRLHIVWFEDEKSIKAKQEFLKPKGITNFAYWAFGYY